MEIREPDVPEEPMLISVPGHRASDLVVPFGVDEGKAYLTNKQILEAENQTAGSGACAVNMQLRLDELVKRNSAGPQMTNPQKVLMVRPHPQRSKSHSSFPSAQKARSTCSGSSGPKSKVVSAITT